MQPEPVATYRLQLRPGFGFDEAAALAPYLAALGVSHLYLSPILQAAEGSLHGYDVTDPQRLNTQLGGAEGFDRLQRALAGQGLSLMQDLVPNHMSIAGRQDRWWWDLLKHGQGSPYAAYFDVDWNAAEERWPGQVLLPALSDHYGRVLEAGGLQVRADGVELWLDAEGQPFPLDPGSFDPGLARAEAGPARDALNRDPEALHALLGRQHYRLARWRAADRDLGYRRFFDVKDLAGLRMEDPAVFAATHALTIALVAEKKVRALRVDHPDGLRDPAQYLRRLRTACPDAWIVVEKILARGEELPADWPVEGGTGYDFLALADGLLNDPRGQAPLQAQFQAFCAEDRDYAAVKLESRRQALEGLLASELQRLAQLFVQVCERHRRHRDYSLHELREALLETAAQFPVYRSYAAVDPETGPRLDAAGRRAIESACRDAAAARPDLDPELFAFLRSICTLRWPQGPELDLALRFQQVCAPAMAKGVEDTAFYRWRPLPSLCEVGADPARFSVSPLDFHQACQRALKEHPYGLLTSSTHDSKHSEDCRARLALLSERPQAWIEAVRRWSPLTARHRGAWRDPLMELTFYQELVAAWPIDAGRLGAGLVKAAREARLHTDWKKPDAAYEAGLRDLVQGSLADPEFMAAVEAFTRRLVLPGRINSLSLALLRLCCPGVPDLYQGCEAWRLSLMDPDNRRPVDFNALQEALRGLIQPPPLAGDDAGHCKQWLIRQALQLRRRRPGCFGPGGAYTPLQAEGPRGVHALAFRRGGSCIAVLPRLVGGLDGDWDGTQLALPEGSWNNVLDGGVGLKGRQPLQRLLQRFPVALLELEDGLCP